MRSHALTLEATHPLPAARARARWRAQVAPVLAAFAPVFGLALAQGGYFPTAWGWASVPLFWAAAVALVVRSRIRLSRGEGIFLAAVAALTCWIAVSASWSVAPAESLLETERALVYIAAALAIFFVARSHHTRHVLAGVLAGISLTAIISLATRLVPDRIGVYDRTGIYRLAEPLGYWNGLALFTAMGALLALGFAARGRTIAARAAAAALLVLLLPTTYFTFGRAAWIALAAGLVAAVAVDPRRLQLLATFMVVAPAPAAAVFVASRKPGLTHPGSTLALAAHDGHRLALLLVVLAVANAELAAAFTLAERRFRIGAIARRAFALSIAAAAVAATATALAWYGGPKHIAKAAYRSFKAPPPHVEGNLNRRLLNFSGNGRADLWRLAWDDARRHPLLGAGAGTYERYFLAHQPKHVGRVRDAHSLYLETLTEVGPVGLALLLVALLTPLLALRHARRNPLVPASFAAYVAYLVHTGVDWDWELPAVTLAGLLCGAAMLIAARRSTARGSIPALARWTLAGGAVVAALFATIALVGQISLSRSAGERERGNEAVAAADARRARALMPWSPAPWQALGRAELAAGLVPQARRSFRKAISIDPGDWELWYDLASATSGDERTHALREVVARFPRSGLVPATAARR